MNDLEFDKTLQQQIDALPRQMKPSRDLWAGIDNAIEQQQQQQQHGKRAFSYQKLSAVAASFAVLGFTAWLTLNANIPLGESNIEASHIAVVPGAYLPGEDLEYVTEMTESFEIQKQDLLVKYEGHKPNADNWRAQLKELDSAAAAIKKVLDQDPSNAQLIKMLQQTYQQQLDLIKAVNKSPWQMI
ncbi:MAG: hypothetical protein MJK04_27605 [Psychrosphaera sp.]|nr:hypothetical protein [Psychrosphaera sp.]